MTHVYTIITACVHRSTLIAAMANEQSLEVSNPEQSRGAGVWLWTAAIPIRESETFNHIISVHS